jgi:hypothetical protein
LSLCGWFLIGMRFIIRIMSGVSYRSVLVALHIKIK